MRERRSRRHERDRNERRGNALRDPRNAEEERQRRRRNGDLIHTGRASRSPQRRDLVDVVLGHRRCREPEDVPDLKRGDDGRDPRRESGRDRIRNEFDQATEAKHPHRDEEHPCHHAGGQQSRETVLGDDGRENDHERGGRPRHLELAASEQRNGNTGEDRCVETMLRRRAHRDGERHRQRQRHDSDDHAGENVGSKVVKLVTLAQRSAQRVGDRESVAAVVGGVVRLARGAREGTSFIFREEFISNLVRVGMRADRIEDLPTE